MRKEIIWLIKDVSFLINAACGDTNEVVRQKALLRMHTLNNVDYKFLQERLILDHSKEVRRIINLILDKVSHSVRFIQED